jgi:hypothetical protein
MANSAAAPRATRATRATRARVTAASGEVSPPTALVVDLGPIQLIPALAPVLLPWTTARFLFRCRGLDRRYLCGRDLIGGGWFVVLDFRRGLGP